MPAPATSKTLSEEEEAYALVAWSNVAHWREWTIRELLIAIPNGAYLGRDVKTRVITMRKLKRAGFTPGVYDYLVPVPVWHGETLYPGLWLELKRSVRGVVSEEQHVFGERMRLLGWKTCVAAGRNQAVDAITQYLQMSGEPVKVGYNPNRRTRERSEIPDGP